MEDIDSVEKLSVNNDSASGQAASHQELYSLCVEFCLKQLVVSKHGLISTTSK